MTSFLPAAERDEAYRRTRAAFLAPSIQAIVVVVVAAVAVVAQSERPSVRPSSTNAMPRSLLSLSLSCMYEYDCDATVCTYRVTE